MVVLEFLKAIIDNFGSAIVVPFIIFIIALIFRVKPAKAFLSALYAGVSLEGFSLIIGAYTPIITPLVQNMSKVMSNVTGVELNTFDVGWQATSVVAFATSAGMIYFRSSLYDLLRTWYRIADNLIPCKMDKHFSAI